MSVEQNDLKIKVVDASVAARGRRKGSPWLVIVGLLLVLLIGGGVFLFWPRQFEFQVGAKPQAIPSSTQAAAESIQQVDEPLVQSAPIAADGESLWVSPTSGEPIDLGYLLPGTQLILHVRVADLLAHVEGEKVLAALGPWGQHTLEQFVTETAVELAEVETLLLGIRLARGGTLDFAMRLRLIQSELPKRWATKTSIATGGFSCVFDSAIGSVLVTSSDETMREILATKGNSPLFPRELQRVLQRTDAMRTVTLAFAGKFLQISEDKFLQGTGEPLREALVDFLGDEATATALSAHWDENFFLELQSTVALNERPHRFAALLEERVAASSDRVEDAILAEPLHPYGRKVLARFPAMLRKLGNYTRGGEEQGLSVLCCYLPVTAGHNLVMATELLLNSATSRVAAVASDIGDVPSTLPRTIGQRLQQTTSLVFPKETLEKALEMLSEDIGVPIKIAGRDLQLEGITKNQSFGLDLREQPAAEILLAVLERANPDRTASGPADVKQKLVYVVREGEGQSGAIVVTTRAAAGRRGEKLPAVFEAATR